MFPNVNIYIGLRIRVHRMHLYWSKQAMWKVGGIEIERAIGCQIFFCGWQKKLVKNRNVLLFGPLFRNKERYCER